MEKRHSDMQLHVLELHPYLSNNGLPFIKVIVHLRLLKDATKDIQKN